MAIQTVYVSTGAICDKFRCPENISWPAVSLKSADRGWDHVAQRLADAGWLMEQRRGGRNYIYCPTHAKERSV